jgi:hypothetical protein
MIDAMDPIIQQLEAGSQNDGMNGSTLQVSRGAEGVCGALRFFLAQ